MSTFKGQNIFGSGPHRFALGRQGAFVVPQSAFGSPGADSISLGMTELDIVVTGRLIAASEAALRTLRDAVVAMLAHPPAPGTLVDNAGRSWPDMSFIHFEEAGPLDRGRAWSVAYEARFRRFNTTPAS